MNYEKEFGKHVFNDTVMKAMLDKETFQSFYKTRKEGKMLDEELAPKIADAMLKWAVSQGATHYVHWFQPMTDTAAGKSEAFLDPVEDGSAILKFSPRALVQGEPDASSFPSGGLRNTFEARGYTAWDPTSSVFVREGIMYIPTCFCGPSGDSLDYKTPLLRSMEAVSHSTVRMLRALGDKEVSHVTTCVGAEQEYFLLDRSLYEKRLDLKICGRTLIGAPPPKSQELDDHYYGRVRIRIAAFMKELDETLWDLGVAAKVKHNEVAPTQHELAVVFESASLTCDNNHLVMETMKTVAKRHDLACLLHEKPFKGVNGSGKHNNYSLRTDTGRNLLTHGKNVEDDIEFMLTLAAFVRGLDIYGALLRLTTATPNNDHRLGGYEAPPPIISMFLGDHLTELLTTCEAKSAGNRAKIETGVSAMPSMFADDADRNRTSPFAFTGNKFEFRMVGSSQSIGLVNTVLNLIVADSFDYIADRIEGAADVNAAAKEVIRSIMKEHGKIVFNGNNYSKEWVVEAKRRGIPVIDNCVDAMEQWKVAKNQELFAKYNVLSERECHSRYEIMMENFQKIINIEASTLLEMMRRQVIPTVMNCAGKSARIQKNLFDAGIYNKTVEEYTRKMSAAITELTDCAETLRNHLAAIPNASIDVQNRYIRDVVRVDMETIRSVSDEVERVIDSREWPMPTYTDLMHRV